MLKDPPPGFQDNDILVLIARTAEKHGNGTFAVEVYRKIHGKSSSSGFRAWISSPTTWKQFATRFEKLGAYSSALDMLRRAFELVVYSKNVSTDTWWFMLAELLERVGSTQEASIARQRARDVELRINMNAANQASRACISAKQAVEEVFHVVRGLALSNCAWVATQSATHASKVSQRALKITKQALEQHMEKKRQEREIRACEDAIRNAIRCAQKASEAAILAIGNYETFEEREAAMTASRAAYEAANFAMHRSDEMIEHVRSMIEARNRSHYASIAAWKAYFCADLACSRAQNIASASRERRSEALRVAALIAQNASLHAEESSVRSQSLAAECMSRLERERQAESFALLATREASLEATKFSELAHRCVLHLSVRLAREVARLASESASRWAEIANSDAETLQIQRQVVKRASDVAMRASMTAVSTCIRLEEALILPHHKRVGNFRVRVEDCEHDVASLIMSQISQPLTVAVVGGIELSRCRIDRAAVRLICDLLSESNEAPRCTYSSVLFFFALSLIRHSPLSLQRGQR